MIKLQIVTADNINKNLLMPKDILSDYPKHLLWIKKCKLEKRPSLIVSFKEKNVGCCILKENSKTHVLKIGYFYICPEYSGLGFGTTLLSELEEYAKLNQYKIIYIRILHKKKKVSTFFEKKHYVPYLDKNFIFEKTYFKKII
ncbi:GNAT family N-acetyltransferase [Enterococcus sp. AZ126]|uniref:GNAT family N-acetyltransferase n=1 Tax=Enterococcus sp. AZ126 TaxID=2774635 RepID=UPI003F20EB90